MIGERNPVSIVFYNHTMDTWNLSVLCRRVMGAMAVPLRSLQFKALSDSATVIRHVVYHFILLKPTNEILKNKIGITY